jgi:hypothetical protein
VKVIYCITLCCICIAVQAQTVRVSARARIAVSGEGATAAYTLDPDCADAQVEGDYVVVVGVRPCTTKLFIVAGNETHGSEVIVSASQAQLDRMKVARLSAMGIHESGNLSTYYSSDRGELETSVELARTMGNHSTSISFAVANGYAYSPSDRRTVFPRASVEFKGPSSTITLLDGYVPEAPTTIGYTKIRGFHVETRNWFFHGGLASLTNFREYLFDHDPDHAIVAGYRASLSKRSSLAADIQWIAASKRYLSGQSGTVGSLLYRFEAPARLRFEAETTYGRGVGFGSFLELTGDHDHLDLRMRSTTARLAGLSTAPPRGTQADGDWSHTFNQAFSMEISGAKSSLSRFDGYQDGNSNLSDRVQWRFHRFTSSAGLAFAEFSQAGGAPLRSLTVPLGLSFEQRTFGNSFQYQAGRNWGTNTGTQLLADSLRVSVKSFSFHAYGGRQTQAPSFEYILANLPLWLRNTLLAAGVSATSPESIQQFLSTNSDLISSGYIRDYRINLSPVRRYAGGSFQWTAPHNRLVARFESRIDDDYRVSGHVVSVNHSLSFSSQVKHNQFTLAASLFRTELLGTTVRVPTVSFGINHQLGNVPDIISRFQERGFIHGLVYFDGERNGIHLTGDRGIEGVLVTLDGFRHTHTNRIGWYSFGSVPPGTHVVEVQYQSDSAFVFTSLPHLQVKENSTADFGIAVRSTQLFGSVRSDAGRGIEGVVVHLSGTNPKTTETLESGSFVFHLAASTEGRISLDLNSLPSGYALDEVHDQSVVVDPDHPGHADFLVRALRSVSGKVSCKDNSIAMADVQLQLDGKAAENVFDASGNYTIRDLSSGRHEIVLSYKSREHLHSVQLAAEPTNLRLDFDICADSPRN